MIYLFKFILQMSFSFHRSVPSKKFHTPSHCIALMLREMLQMWLDQIKCNQLQITGWLLCRRFDGLVMNARYSVVVSVNTSGGMIMNTSSQLAYIQLQQTMQATFLSCIHWYSAMICSYAILLQPVQTEKFALSVVLFLMRDECKSVRTKHGALCVMTTGEM